MPTLLVVAGPNGCGKSTLTRTSGFSGLEMIDPDTFARSMSSGEATREALRRRRRALGEKRSYLVETTLAGAGILRHMEAARSEATGLSCTIFPSLQRIRRLTASATGLRWEDTMYRKPTCAADSCGHVPICRLWLRWQTKSFSMTIPVPTGHTGWLRSSRRRCSGFRTTFLVGLDR